MGRLDRETAPQAEKTLAQAQTTMEELERAAAAGAALSGG